MRKLRFFNFFMALIVYLGQISLINAENFSQSYEMTGASVYSKKLSYWTPAYSKNSQFSSKQTSSIPKKNPKLLSVDFKKSKVTSKRTRKIIVLAIICTVTAVSLGCIIGYLYWKHNQQISNRSTNCLETRAVIKPTCIITSNSSLNEKIQKQFSEDLSQLKIDGGHSHDTYIQNLEKHPNLSKVKKLIINRTGNIKRVHAPEGKFENFDAPDMKIQKEQFHMSWEDFQKIASISSLQNINHLTLNGFLFSPPIENLKSFEKYEAGVESAANHTTLVQNFPGLQSLTLENCTLDIRFAQILENHCLKNFEIINSSFIPHEDLPDLFRKPSSIPLTSLSIVGCQLNDHQARKILYSEPLQAIEKVDFSNNNLSNNFLFKKIIHFFEVWKFSKHISSSLKFLNLSNNLLISENATLEEFSKEINSIDSHSVFNNLKNRPQVTLNLGQLSANEKTNFLTSFLEKTLGKRLKYENQ